MYSSEHAAKEWTLSGSYNSSLTAEYYQKLLALLNDAISSGDLSGGSAFDKATLLKLEEQAQSFASLPTGTAGVRVMDDSLAGSTKSYRANGSDWCNKQSERTPAATTAPLFCSTGGWWSTTRAAESVEMTK